ncbi:MAG: TlpA disulfide reductase family protein [Myxococcota bacterium]
MLALACGASTSGAVGETHAERGPQAIELALRRPSGEWIHIGDLRGRPVLLFVFATFDGVSQAALRPTSRFARNHPETHVIGIAAQPDAAPLLDPYERALSPNFPLTYDPARDVHHGTSTLGSIGTVPTYIMLDARGLEVERWVGFPNSRTLDRLLEQALSRGGVREEPENVPLLAE